MISAVFLILPKVLQDPLSRLRNSKGRCTGFATNFEEFVQLLPLVSMIFYLMSLIDALENISLCSSKVTSIYFAWVHLENVLFYSNLFGMAIWLFCRFVVSRNHDSMYKYDLFDEDCRGHTDILQRRHWESRKMQCAVINFFVSNYVYSWDYSKNVTSFLNIITGGF